MKDMMIYEENIKEFLEHLRLEEKSIYTISKYSHDVRTYYSYADGRPLTKNLVMEYKEHLISNGYKTDSINSMLAALNSFLTFIGRTDCKVKHLRCQRKVYCRADKELSKAEYLRLLEAAKDKPRIRMIIETICATGIRVSELSYFTVEAIQKGEVAVSCKNKTRSILIPGKLKKRLLDYCRRQDIKQGIIFRTKSGCPVDRSNIWAEMKKLCQTAKVLPGKVFPHNLRKLFARTFYKLQKDIARLADLLGHSNINTTRIYIMTTGTEHRRQIDKMGLVV